MAALAAAQAPEVPPVDPLAEVDGVLITASEVDAALGAALTRLQQQVYELRRRKLSALIDERLFAAEASRRGIGVDDLLALEVEARLAPVTEEEVSAALPALRPGEDPARRSAAAAQARSRLLARRREARRREFVESLRRSADIVIRLEPPPPVRVEVSTRRAPVRGPEAAPVTIVAFSDFDCPACRSVQATLGALRIRYPEEVRFVHRDFPRESGERAAEAARCAGDQGRFWEYHDGLYAGTADVDSGRLTALARTLGLDIAAFSSCLAAGAHRAELLEDRQEGVQLGVTRTPTFFVNGRSLLGAQPLEAFTRLVDDELARQRQGKARAGKER